MASIIIIILLIVIIDMVNKVTQNQQAEGNPMNQHKLLHMTLSKSFKLLIEDFQLHGNRPIGSIGIKELMEWAEKEAGGPTEPKIEG